MDVPFLVAEHIIKFLPKSKYSKFNNTCYTNKISVLLLRQVSYVFCKLLSLHYLQKECNANLFQQQYSTILLRELIFDYRFSVFPLQQKDAPKLYYDQYYDRYIPLDIKVYYFPNHMLFDLDDYTDAHGPHHIPIKPFLKKFDI